MLEHVKTIFFDYDGTLHESLIIYAPAFRKGYDYLVQNGFAESREWTREEISYWLGFNAEDMWENFMPFLPYEIKQTASDIISKHMEQLLKHGAAQLYEGALETLDYLKNKGYTLVFLSNCKIYYKEGHNKLFGLDKYFTSLVGSEEYNYIPKYEILKQIRPDYPEEMVMIGDRIHDMEAGKKNGIHTIGCNYGYALPGELEEADYRIDNIRELRELL